MLTSSGPADASRGGTPDTPFAVTIVDSAEALPAAADKPIVCGTLANSNQLAFGLGKCDINAITVKR